MPRLLASTFAVHPNEQAFLLREVMAPAPDFKGKHRYQCIAVVRDDTLVRYVRDMGPWSNFPNKGRGQAWETVASIQATADDLRNAPDNDPWDEIPAMTTEQYNEAFAVEQDKQDRRIKGRKTFGALPKGR